MWQVRILDTLATYPGLKIFHIKGEGNISDGLSRIDHKIAQVAKMTPEALDDRKPIDKAIIKAMEKWPKIRKDGYEEYQPPQLPAATMKEYTHWVLTPLHYTSALQIHRRPYKKQWTQPTKLVNHTLPDPKLS